MRFAQKVVAYIVRVRGRADPLRLYWLPLRQAHVVGAGQAAMVGRLLD